MLSFEYHEEKSRANQVKHGIDFRAAQQLWEDPNALEVATTSLSEPRFLIIGVLEGKHWSAIFTYRGNRIRLISARRSRDRERMLMKARDFDKKFDDGVEDIVEHLNMATVRRPNQEQKRVNVDFPTWVVESLDREASRIGVTRQSIIKVWLVERLQREALQQRELELAGQQDAPD